MVSSGRDRSARPQNDEAILWCCVCWPNNSIREAASRRPFPPSCDQPSTSPAFSMTLAAAHWTCHHRAQQSIDFRRVDRLDGPVGRTDSRRGERPAVNGPAWVPVGGMVLRNAPGLLIMMCHDREPRAPRRTSNIASYLCYDLSMAGQQAFS